MAQAGTCRGPPHACSVAAALLVSLLWLALTGCRPVIATAVGVHEIEPAELEHWQAQGVEVLVLDLRPAEQLAQGRIPGARAVSIGQLDGLLTRRPPPAEVPIVAVCKRGYRSLEAAATARAYGLLRSYSLAGGMERWRSLGLPLERSPAEALDPAIAKPPELRASTFLQGAVVATAYGVKPLYMVLSLLLILWLRRAKERDLVILRWGLASFLAGEALCAVNYLAFHGGSVKLELGHGIGMVAMGGLIAWGLFALLDRRVLRLTDATAPCAAARFCRRCAKREPVACGLVRTMLVAAPLTALVALVPLSTPLNPQSVLIEIVGTPVLYRHPMVQQLTEFRVFPLLAVVLLVSTTAQLAKGLSGVGRAQLAFFAAIGLMAYSLLRYLLRQAFHAMPPWADVWEELTELAMVLLMGALLIWFRGPLGLSIAPPDPPRQTPRR